MEPKVPHTSPLATGGNGAIDLTPEEPFHGRLLLSDLRVGYVLFDEARYRVAARLFGVSRDQAPLVAMIGAGLVLKAAHEKILRLGAPTLGDAALGTSGANVLLHRIGGPSSDTIQGFGALVAIALLGHGAKPAIRGSLHRVRTSSEHLHVMFDHRYGHLVRPIHRHLTRQQ